MQRRPARAAAWSNTLYRRPNDHFLKPDQTVQRGVSTFGPERPYSPDRLPPCLHRGSSGLQLDELKDTGCGVDLRSKGIGPQPVAAGSRQGSRPYVAWRHPRGCPHRPTGPFAFPPAGGDRGAGDRAWPPSRTILRPEYAWFRFILCCQLDSGRCAHTGLHQGRESHRTGERSISRWFPPSGKCASAL